jgi:hypothetical protein
MTKETSNIWLLSLLLPSFICLLSSYAGFLRPIRVSNKPSSSFPVLGILTILLLDFLFIP